MQLMVQKSREGLLWLLVDLLVNAGLLLLPFA